MKALSTLSREKALFFLVGLVFLASTASAYSQQYWLDKPAWDDRPSYAENITIDIQGTDLIQERVTREVCTEYNTTDVNGTLTGDGSCLNYENQTMPGGNKKIINIEAGRNKYLGNGRVRTNISWSGNELSRRTFLAGSIISYLVYGESFSEQDYVDWFNQRYYYNGENITVENISSLESRVKELSARGENTAVLASKIQGISFDKDKGIVFDSTVVFRFKDFRAGVLNLSDLLKVEVDSGLEN